MGAYSYYYIVPYQHDLAAALHSLREAEFLAGRYYPVMQRIRFPITAESPRPGAMHASIDAAREAAGEDGTRSILDIDHIATEPTLCGATPVYDDTLRAIFGTTEPTREQVLSSLPETLELVLRGMCSFVVMYDQGREANILFFGYSFD